MPSLNDHSRLGKEYWRSLEERADTPEFREFLHREFPAGAADMLDGTSRRGFLRIMGASLALAGMGISSCRWPTEKIMPYASNPDNFTPGEPKQFATAFELAGVGFGVLATSYDGRPIKLEGNPSHPFSLGATDAITQASILDLYDPDRSTAPLQRSAGAESAVTWDEFILSANSLFADQRRNQGRGLRILSEISNSPSLLALRERFANTYPLAKWYEYEPLNDDNSRNGSIIAFGRPYRTQLELSKARVIVSLDSDFLLAHPTAVRNTRDFAAGRNPAQGWMSRLYVAESRHSLTGAQADHRIPLRNAEVAGLATAIASELFVGRGLALPPAAAALQASLASVQAPAAAAEHIGNIVNDLMANRGQCLVLVGESQPAEVHALGHIINAALGNFAQTLSCVSDPNPSRTPSAQNIAELTGELKSGGVDTLVILGGNPAYDAPADLGFADALGKVRTTLHLSYHDNETSKLCGWHVPRAHFLESWSDAVAWDGTLSITQPLIEPLYGGWTSAELLSLIAEPERRRAYEIVRGHFDGRFSAAGDESLWRTALHDGIVSGSGSSKLAPGIVGPPQAGILLQLAAGSGTEPELLFAQDYKVYDGRFGTNGWLQEMPDQMTKITWDNPLQISYQDGQKLGLKDGDMVRLETQAGALDLPVYIVPGQAQGSYILTLGYGRQRSGRIASGVGFNSYLLRTTLGMNRLDAVKLTKLGRKYKLAQTQDHFAIDKRGFNEREQRVPLLVREASLDDFKADPTTLQHRGHEIENVQLWAEPVQYTGHKWAMAIDLNTCTGCGACITACQAENNIPIVGKDYVRRGREMHWIRVDRYFAGDPEKAEVVNQPMTCHHCENAPCEQVCPVGATTHTHEGLNDMVFNRCIGTRYCSNNCPYKVRRFNFLNYRKHMTPIEKLGTNPEVTVRSRGVMEKCSYCVQRIQNVKIVAKRENRPIADLEIVTACMGACPAQAITFGDLSDPQSKVSQLQKNERSYIILGDLMTKPRTKYLGKLRNPAGGASSRVLEHGNAAHSEGH